MIALGPAARVSYSHPLSIFTPYSLDLLLFIPGAGRKKELLGLATGEHGVRVRQRMFASEHSPEHRAAQVGSLPENPLHGLGGLPDSAPRLQLELGGEMFKQLLLVVRRATESYCVYRAKSI